MGVYKGLLKFTSYTAGRNEEWGGMVASEETSWGDTTKWPHDSAVERLQSRIWQLPLLSLRQLYINNPQRPQLLVQLHVCRLLVFALETAAALIHDIIWRPRVDKVSKVWGQHAVYFSMLLQISEEGQHQTVLGDVFFAWTYLQSLWSLDQWWESSWGGTDKNYVGLSVG